MQPETQSVGRIRPVGTVIALAVAAGSASDLQREQARRDKIRAGKFRLHFNAQRLTAKCRCACGLLFTTKGIAQHQNKCAIQQARWSSPNIRNLPRDEKSHE